MQLHYPLEFSIVDGTSREDETSANLIIVSFIFTATNCQDGTCKNPQDK